MDKMNFDCGDILRVMRQVFNPLVAVFLSLSLVLRFSSIFYYPPYNGYIAAFLGVLILGCVFVIVFEKFLIPFFFLFGFSFFLFGFPSIDMVGRLFEIVVTCFATTLFLINRNAKRTHQLNRFLALFLISYTILASFSIFLLPIKQVVRDLCFFDFWDFLFYVSTAPPYNFLYPFPGVWRLVLFTVLALEMSIFPKRYEIFKTIFVGLFLSSVFCSFIGILDFFEVISLGWFRYGEPDVAEVLHSTFMNRGVFSEFLLTVTPFVLIGFSKPGKGKIWKLSLFGFLIICEVALILSGSRAGYVSYPIVILMCWVFFYFSSDQRLFRFDFNWKELIKIFVSAPITIALSLLLISYVFIPLATDLKNERNLKGNGRDLGASTEYLVHQASTMFRPNESSRPMRWRQGLGLGGESPLFGMGYESYSWHESVLSGISSSEYAKVNGSLGLTPHNTYLQLFASNGIVGLIIWLLIVGTAFTLLVFDFVRNKHLLNIPVMVSIIGFHLVGIFQAMQYIPVIWILIFLNLGYAMTVDENVLPDRIRTVMRIAGKVVILLLLTSFFVYLGNFESSSLAKKYDKRIYAFDQDWDRYAGFFQPSKRWKYGDFRWFSKRGGVYVSGGEVELAFHCRTPGWEDDPVVLKVFHDGRLLDKITFSGKKKSSTAKQTKIPKRWPRYTVIRKYDLGKKWGKPQELLFEVSRTWVPHDAMGNFDRRELGLGVKILKK